MMQKTVFVLIILIVIVMGMQSLQAEDTYFLPEPADKPAYLWDEYHVIMWGAGGQIHKPGAEEAMHECGANAGLSLGASSGRNMQERGFVSYTDGMGKIGIWSQWENWRKRLIIYDEKAGRYKDSFEGFMNWNKQIGKYVTSMDKKYLVNMKGMCWNNPHYLAYAEKKVRNRTIALKPYAMIAHQICDEPSMTHYSAPGELCFCAYCQEKFRTRLKSRFKTVQALNKAWDTDYKSWNEVIPVTSFEILSDKDRSNFAPWADFREFMDDTFIEVLEALTAAIYKERPEVSIGFGGTQCPSAVTGYDFWRWAKFQSFCEPYNMGDSRELLRSFPPVRNTVKCMFPNPRNRKLVWWQLFHGDRGVMLWSFNDLIKMNNGTYQLIKDGKLIAPSLHKLRSGIGKFVMTSQRLCEPIGLLYSQTSLRAAFLMCGSLPDATGSAVNNDHDYARMAFSRLIEDLGMQYKYVSYEQLKKGELLKSKYRFFYLPMSVSLSKEEIDSLEEYVKEGGTLVADYLPGIMDEHCRILDKGRLDDLFKVSRTEWRFAPSVNRGVTVKETVKWPALKGKSMPLYPVEKTLVSKGAQALAAGGNVPCLLHTAVGKGHCYYLNWDMGRYITLREAKSQDQETLKSLFANLLKDCGVTPSVSFKQVSGSKGNFEIFQWKRLPAYLISLQRASDFQESAVGGMGKDAEGKESSDTLKVSMPVSGHVYEIISGTYLGKGDKVNVNVPVISGALLVIIPYKPKSLGVTLKDNNRCTVVLETDAAETCGHVIHVDAVVNGKVDPVFAHNIVLDSKGRWEGTLPMKRLTLKGKTLIRVKDVVSGLSAEKEMNK